MKSPKDMKIIQIDITNACVYTCSNCTRMCGHHAKPFMMDFDTFKRAVDSLDGFKGTISVMGGEPTLHPEFEKFALYLQSKYTHLYGDDKDTQLLHPMTDFMKTIQDVGLEHTDNNQGTDGDTAVITAPGLFSAMCGTYLKHFEIIQDTFKTQGLNDHTNEMYHQASLISRKDLGIPDNEWIELRDNCWLQNTWSASVTPKGTFFCEVAGALDMLFDGPGGWPIEAGWWKKTPDQFGDQLHWCELCGFACDTFTRNANDKIDDVSTTLYKKLETVNSPKLKDGLVNLIEIDEGIISEKSKVAEFTYSSNDVSSGSPYIKYNADKFNMDKTILHPQDLVVIYNISNDCTYENMQKKVDFSKENYKYTYAICENENIYKKWTECSKELDGKIYNLEDTPYAHILNNILPQINSRDYIVLLSDTVDITNEFISKFKKSTANPGTLIYTRDLSNIIGIDDWINIDSDKNNQSFLAIFNNTALSIRQMGFDRIAYVKNIQEFADLWTKKKCIPFDNNLFTVSSKESINAGERCAVFGGGGRASDIYYIINKQKAKCVAIVDSNPEKQGLSIEGITVKAPDDLKSMINEIDRMLIGSPIYFEEMKAKLMEIGFEESIISSI